MPYTYTTTKSLLEICIPNQRQVIPKHVLWRIRDTKNASHTHRNNNSLEVCILNKCPIVPRHSVWDGTPQTAKMLVANTTTNILFELCVLNQRRSFPHTPYEASQVARLLFTYTITKIFREFCVPRQHQIISKQTT